MESVLVQFASTLRLLRSERWRGGGFSGAQLWRLETPVGPLCLRRWPPEHPNAERLTLIHNVLLHAASRGVDFLPVPLPAIDRRTFVEHDGTLWELAPWLPGEPNFSRDPRPEKLRTALAALARFHVATADFPSAMCRVAPSPGIASRLVDVGQISNPSVPTLRQLVDGRIGNPSYIEIVTLFRQLAPLIQPELAAAALLKTWLQPAIRDVWADHFLFTGDEVTGLVDFGGVNIDTPATDIARLLGNMADDDANRWKIGLAAYESIRPLSHSERQLIPVFDRSSVLLSGMNWLRWLYIDGRTFSDPTAIDMRLTKILERLRRLAHQHAITVRI